jgi:hypothetical protein
VRDVGDLGAEPVGLPLELRLPGGMQKQQPEPGWFGRGGGEQPVDAGLGEFADLLAEVGGQQGLHPVQDRLVQVGLGLEVPVQDHPRDARLGGDVVQAGVGESGAGERLRRGR